MTSPATQDDVAPARAPGDGPDGGSGEQSDRGVSSHWRTATVVLLVLTLVGAVAGGWALRTSTHRPSEGSAEVGFARDMIQHHQQAVTMSFLVRERTDDPEVRSIAHDMITAQAEEMGMLTAWLRRNEIPASTTLPAMAWMATPVPGDDEHGAGHAEGDEPMTMADLGMASDGDLADLARLDGREAEVRFLELMRAHHVGGATMIDAYLDRATDDELRSTAEGMLTAQTREVRQIDLLAEARGVPA